MASQRINIKTYFKSKLNTVDSKYYHLIFKLVSLYVFLENVILIWIMHYQGNQAYLTVIKHFVWLAIVYRLMKNCFDCRVDGILEICFYLMVLLLAFFLE